MTLLEELFRKYLREEITPAELEQFRQLATHEGNRVELDRLLAEWIEADFPTDHPEELDIDALYKDVTEKWRIPKAPAVGTEGRAVGGRGVRFFWFAAAACLLLFAGVRLLRRPPVIPIAPVAKAAVTIPPASTKATLILANGSRIILDNAANGHLAQQGNTMVIKLNDGQLAYQAAKAGGPIASDTLYNYITTPRGGFYQLTLPDGSRVWLDAASSLRFPTAFTGKERMVELTGEAYFEIEPKAAQPFLVKTNGVKINVLGTSFNVMAYGDEDAVRTTLVSGSIRVAAPGQQKLATPGEQLSWTRGEASLRVSKPDMRQVLAWKQGEFRFDGLTISAIMRQIARWYDVDVEFRGPQPANEFSGVIPRKKEASELLTVLEQTDEVHFELQGRKIIVTKP